MQTLRSVVNALVALLFPLSTLAFGQEYTDEAVDKSSWVVPYALVVLGIGLGVYIISKPARREK